MSVAHTPGYEMPQLYHNPHRCNLRIHVFSPSRMVFKAIAKNKGSSEQVTNVAKFDVFLAVKAGSCLSFALNPAGDEQLSHWTFAIRNPTFAWKARWRYKCSNKLPSCGWSQLN